MHVAIEEVPPAAIEQELEEDHHYSYDANMDDFHQQDDDDYKYNQVYSDYLSESTVATPQIQIKQEHLEENADVNSATESKVPILKIKIKQIYKKLKSHFSLTF